MYKSGARNSAFYVALIALLSPCYAAYFLLLWPANTFLTFMNFCISFIKLLKGQNEK